MLHSLTSSTWPNKCHLLRKVTYSPDCLHLSRGRPMRDWFSKGLSGQGNLMGRRNKHVLSTCCASGLWLVRAAPVILFDHHSSTLREEVIIFHFTYRWESRGSEKWISLSKAMSLPTLDRLSDRASCNPPPTALKMEVRDPRLWRW